MLTIEIKVNGELIGGAMARNVSGLAEVSSYEVEAVEKGSEVTGLPDFRTHFQVPRHNRAQTVWALAKKIAENALEDQEVAAENRVREAG